MNYILIIILFGGSATAVVDFNSLAACEKAKAEIVRGTKDRASTAHIGCHERGNSERK